MIYLIAFLTLCLMSAATCIAQNTTPAIVSAEAAAASALSEGDEIPTFSLTDATGKRVSSIDLLKSGPVVLVFYRGAWCPYCNLYLRSLQKSLPNIENAGGKLVAISVEEPDTSLSVVQKNELAYTVLSDPKLSTARKFGLVFELPAETNEQYKGFGIDLVKQNNMPKPELPISATYVVGKDGKIAFAHVDADYKKRAEPAAVIKALRSITRK